MKTQYANALAAKVAAVNLANSEANRLYVLLVPIFKTLEGQKVTKADGSFLESVKKLLPALPTYQTTGNHINAYLTTGNGYSVRLEVKVSEAYTGRNGDYRTQSAESTAYIADLTAPEGASFNAARQYLGKFTPDHSASRRSDYTPSEIETLRMNLREAKEKVSSLQSSLFYFGEYEQNA